MILAYFTRNNCRILKNHPNEQELASLPNVVVDPDLSAVKGFPPHFWKLDGGKIVPMTPPERAARAAHIAKHGADNEIRTMPVKVYRKPIISAWVWVALAGAMVGFSIGMAVGRLAP